LSIFDFQQVSIKIYDLQGRPVMTVLEEILPAGEHRISIDAGELLPGIYILRLSAVNSQQSAISKFIIIK
jgi:hypothetical protein